MPIDYSKWDNIELSDDSDIEVHPNVDKKSFIKWKQQDIHQKRDQRNHDIKQLEIQIPMYEELNIRANKMLKDLSDDDLGDLQTVKAYLLKTFDQSKPANPTLSAEDFAEQPTYSEMIEDLFFQLKDQLRTAKRDPNDGANLRAEIINHHKKINQVLEQNKEKLSQLYKEKELHISSEDIHTGWDRSFLNKSESKESDVQRKTTQTSSPLTTSSTSKEQEQPKINETKEKPKELVTESKIQDEETGPQIHPDTIKLSQIPTKDHSQICEFLKNHSFIITPSQKDALLMTAFDAQFSNQSARTKQIIYHSCLIQYVLDIMQYQKTTNPYQIKIIIEQLFKNIFSGPKSNAALEALNTEVNTTFEHIKTRCEILSKEQRTEEEEDEDANAQIQLKSLDDNVELKVDIPSPEETERYEAFTTLLPIPMQEAMKTGSLDAVNEVFAKIPYKQAETILEVFQDFGFIGVQEGVIEDEQEWKEIKENFNQEELSSKVEELDVQQDNEETFVSTADIID